MMIHSNTSEYTLDSVNDTAPLLQESPSLYGSHDDTHPRPSSTRLLLVAALRMAALFLVASLLLGGILFLALPTLDPEDRLLLHLPKSFDDLKALNGLLKKYRDIHPKRIIICYVISYLFVQAFSLPGSMYLSILGGAVWGVPVALPLACTCVATGATLCYFISAAFGPALLTLPKWKDRLDKWSEKLRRQKDNIFSFLIVLRIAPLPPHWVINVVCPHVGIRLLPFWSTTWLGVFGVTVIHTTIGGGLDEMTTAADFNLFSWKNFFLLSAVVVGVLIPVGLRYYFRRDIASVAAVEDVDLEQSPQDIDDHILAVGPLPLSKKPASTQLTSIYVNGNRFYADDQLDQDEDIDDEDEDDDDEDVILEAGPAIVIKSPEDGSSSGSVAH